MRALGRALQNRGDTFMFPYPLPAEIWRGDTVMLLAAPKVGKSLIACDYAVKVAAADEPVLYITTDTSIGEQATRAAANIFGVRKSTIAADADQWGRRLTGVGWPLRWSSADITISMLDDLLDAEAEYWGCYPSLVVVDVAHDMLEGEEGPNTARIVWRKLHALGRRTNAVILALHHVRAGDAAGGDMFVSMTDAKFPVSYQTSEVVLTGWRGSPGQMSLHLAKNRGSQDGMTVQLGIDYERARVT
jgi:predicted ATP-dependent serine protease